jgi:hypothetical protein
MALPHKSAPYPNLAAVLDLPLPTPAEPGLPGDQRRRRRRA